jgi:hypothetical protein
MTRRADEQEQSGSNMEDSSQRAMSRQDIDQVLHSKRRNEVKSCYPCRQRKVRDLWPTLELVLDPTNY